MTKINTGSISWRIIDRDGYKTIWVSGTDDAKDVLVSLKCWPDCDGYHYGAMQAALSIYHSDEFQAVYDYGGLFEVAGSSMGGAIAECLASQIPSKVRNVVLYNSYPVGNEEMPYEIRRIIKGRENVHYLFPWFKLMGKIEYLESEKRWPMNWWYDHITISADESKEG